MGICDEVRAHCALVTSHARSVTIDLAKLEAFEAVPQATLDASLHHLDGPPEEVARYLLTLDAINFGSGWFPTLHKRPGHSGYATVAASLTDHFRAAGPWTNGQLRAIDTQTIAGVLGQQPGQELMSLYAQALHHLGASLGNRSALDWIAAAAGSAERMASQAVLSMPLFRDRPFYKRAQLLPTDLALAGVAQFDDLDRLTIFADNVVPHVLRCDGVLEYDEDLASRIDSECLLEPGREEREIRACALIACERLAEHHGIAPRVLDHWLWNRGQAREYKARPRHRCRCVYY